MLTRQELYSIYHEGPAVMIKLVDNLLDRLAEVEQQVGRRQQRTIDHQQQQITRLTAQLARLEQKMTRLAHRNFQLERRVEELAARRVVRDSHNSHQPPSTDCARTVKRTRSLRRPSGKRPGGQVGHPGHTRARVEVADHIITHSPAECQECGGSMADGYIVASERRQVVDLVPARLHTVEHRSLTKRCGVCGQRTKGKFPPSVRAAVQYGGGVRARAVYLTKYQLLPVGRASELMGEVFGCRMSPATLAGMTAECAENLVDTELRIKAAIQGAEVVHMDETGIRVAGGGHYVHVASTARLTHYSADERRGRGAIETIGILPGYTGVCVHDGWPAYGLYVGCQHALCGAHLLRELTYIEESHPHQAGEWAQPMITLLLEIKAAVDAWRASGAVDLGAECQAEFLRRYDQIVRRGLELNPERTRHSPATELRPGGERKRGGAIKQSEAHNLVSRLDVQRARVLRYMTDFGVPFDNNQAERDLRMMKVQQKVSGCFRTAAGAARFCRIRGYVSTMRKQGQGALAALERVFSGQQTILTS